MNIRGRLAALISTIAARGRTTSIAQPALRGMSAMAVERPSHDEFVRMIEEQRVMTQALRGFESTRLEISKRQEQQASDLMRIASTMQELSATVKQNVEHTQQANRLAIGASNVTIKGGAVAREAVDKLSSINEILKKIAELGSVINAIAFQTDILAVNAALEAVRKGEQGDGFALVATDMKALAQRNAEVARDIKTLIGEAAHEVRAGANRVEETGKAMQEIVNSVRQATDALASIAATSRAQNAAIVPVNQVVRRVGRVARQNAALVDAAAVKAASLNEQASGLAQVVTMVNLAQQPGGMAPQRPVLTLVASTRCNLLGQDA